MGPGPSPVPPGPVFGAGAVGLGLVVLGGFVVGATVVVVVLFATGAVGAVVVGAVVLVVGGTVVVVVGGTVVVVVGGTVVVGAAGTRKLGPSSLVMPRLLSVMVAERKRPGVALTPVNVRVVALPLEVTANDLISRSASPNPEGSGDTFSKSSMV